MQQINNCNNRWPRVSIITPSFNQDKYLEETIQSVLLQGYPDLEYIIIDGGSSDKSLEIIRRYEQWLAYWVSEPDCGQSHALNKGFRRATGEICAWLNSDDTFEPGAVKDAVKYLLDNPDIGLVYGHAKIVDMHGQLIGYWYAPEFDLGELLFTYKYIPQQSAFFRRSVLEEVGGVQEDFYYAMDYDLWLRIAAKYPIHRLDQFMGNYREHPTSKTLLDRYANRPEIYHSLERLFLQPGLPASISKLETTALSFLRIHQGLAAFQNEDYENGECFLKMAFQLDPSIVSSCRERVISLLVAYSPDDFFEAKNYFLMILKHLPKIACSLRPLIIFAQNRRLIISAINTREGKLRRLARKSLLSTFLHDRQWLSDRQLMKGIISLFADTDLLDIIIGLKQKAIEKEEFT